MGMIITHTIRHFLQKYFSDFGKIYHEPSCWQLLYHQYQSNEERWAYMARSGCVMLDLPAGQTYLDLYELVKHKPYYIITTNQDAQFAKVFDPERIFYHSRRCPLDAVRQTLS